MSATNTNIRPLVIAPEPSTDRPVEDMSPALTVPGARPLRKYTEEPGKHTEALRLVVHNPALRADEL